MHLKSLTLKGFKSFASATTLRFEPGITCVVGPNGSGKSNVVDALTWVMGEQGAKSLRGGSMQDVIFAGTSSRAPLGRAEVTLTIDNADGALPIDYSEVSVTRRVFRDGASEYEINGSSCRLMDVQELLSDTGIGREMHVVVGQGRLATILESRPEDRRAFIEEAAGVLKHRRRKEKALRKLEGMSANLARLTDLTTELRRQLKPLGRQAEVARRAQTVQADLRDARLRLAADDLLSRRTVLAEQLAAHARAQDELSRVQGESDGAEAELAVAEAAAAELSPAAEAAGQTWFRLAALAERVGATTRIAAERARHLAAPAQDRRGRDPDELDAEAERAAATEAALQAEVAAAREALTRAQAARRADEQAAAAAEKAHLAEVRAVADRREGLARLSGEVDTLRSRVEGGEAELARLEESMAEAAARAGAARAEHAEAARAAGELDEGELGLDERHERAVGEQEAARARVLELTAAERVVAQDVASGQARVEALSVGLTRRDGAAWLLERGGTGGAAGVGGPLTGSLTVRAGWETALAAALGPLADAVLADDPAAGLAAVRALKADDGGRAGLVVPAQPPVARVEGQLPDGATWAFDLVEAAPQVAPALAHLLAGIAVVADLDAAAALVAYRPEVTAVTGDGDLVGAGWLLGGSDRVPSTLEVQAAIDAAEGELDTARRRVGELAAALGVAQENEAARGEVTEQTLAALHESDAAHAAVAEQLGRLGQTVRAAEDEAQRVSEHRARLAETRSRSAERLADVEERLALARQEPTEHEPTTAGRDEAAARLADSRAAEVEARLVDRSAQERADASRGRADSLRRSAAAEREARQRAAAAERRRAEAARLAGAIAAAGERVGERVSALATVAGAERDRVAAQRVDTDRAVAACRDRTRTLAGELTGLTASVHRDEVGRAEAALRIDQLTEQVVEAHGIEPDALIAEYGPDVALPPPAAEVAEAELARERGEQVSMPGPVPYVRVEQQARAKQAAKDLALLGKVNPLALEEFAALEERYAFLSTQLADVTAARKDLMGVVAQVDERILELFTSAYEDVAAEFGAVFTTLFPGGEARLVLTEPDDLLRTGVEVEARPPGKKITRLSLLSGGEKSLTAVAMLVAIFRARPSPFYVMDEVEAALDDTNLRRLLTLFSQLRERSQLIVITHQKPTMEVADALYGVSMRGDGITTVISQRLRGRDVMPNAAPRPATGALPTG